MIEFVFMLTHYDRTVPQPAAVLEQVTGTGLRFVGFKDVGADIAELREVCELAHTAGMQVMLEVVSTAREEELRSVAAAPKIGVDWLLGGTHPRDAVKVLRESGAKRLPRYCPFPGKVVGYPSVLLGEIAEIAHSAREMTATDGVHGLDLLTYRHPSADPGELTRQVVQAADGPVIAAGSVANSDQIRALASAGAWGFTIGGAIFEGLFPGGPDIAPQVQEILRVASDAGTSRALPVARN